jgi:hypothetical protein
MIEQITTPMSQYHAMFAKDGYQFPMNPKRMMQMNIRADRSISVPVFRSIKLEEIEL